MRAPARRAAPSLLLLQQLALPAPVEQLHCPASHLRVALQDGEEHIVHLQEDTAKLPWLQVLQRDREQDVKGQADVVRVADALLPFPKQNSQDFKNRLNHY